MELNYVVPQLAENSSTMNKFYLPVHGALERKKAPTLPKKYKICKMSSIKMCLEGVVLYKSEMEIFSATKNCVVFKNRELQGKKFNGKYFTGLTYEYFDQDIKLEILQFPKIQFPWKRSYLLGKLNSRNFFLGKEGNCRSKMKLERDSYVCSNNLIEIFDDSDAIYAFSALTWWIMGDPTERG